MAGLHVFEPHLSAREGECVALSREQSRHLIKSLRARTGEAVAILNGDGVVYHGALATAGSEARIRIDRVETTPARAPQLALAAALLKGRALDDGLRDIITLGLGRLIPLRAARCETKLDAERAETRLQRWKTAAVEACKQSGNPWAPTFDTPREACEFFRNADAIVGANTWKFIGSLEADAAPVLETLARLKREAPSPDTLLLAVGPEGDFSPEEYAAARAGGFIPVRFPGYVFRAAPAALVGLSFLAGVSRS